MKTSQPKPRAEEERIEEILTSFYYEGAVALKNNKLNENLKQLLPRRVEQILEILSRREREVREMERKYHELILAVGNKFEGETRHQTALRYIKRAEEENCKAMQVK